MILFSELACVRELGGGGRISGGGRRSECGKMSGKREELEDGVGVWGGEGKSKGWDEWREEEEGWGGIWMVR